MQIQDQMAQNVKSDPRFALPTMFGYKVEPATFSISLPAGDHECLSGRAREL